MANRVGRIFGAERVPRKKKVESQGDAEEARPEGDGVTSHEPHGSLKMKRNLVHLSCKS